MRIVGLMAALLLGVSPARAQPREDKATPEPRFAIPCNLYRHPSGDLLPVGAVGCLGSGRLRHFRPECLLFSPDGKILLSWSDADACIRFWDAVSGREIRRIVAHMGTLRVSSLALFPDNKGLAVACWQGVTLLLDAETAQVRLRLQAGAEAVGSRFQVAFSPDGKTLATSDGLTGVKLWDVKTGKTTRRLTTPRKALYSNLAFLAEGKYVRFWRSASLRMLTSFGECHNALRISTPPDSRSASRP